MDKSQEKHIAKTKDDKDASKALKKLEKEKRKMKSLQKADKGDTASSSLNTEIISKSIPNKNCNDTKNNNLNSLPPKVSENLKNTNKVNDGVVKSITKKSVITTIPESKKPTWFKNLFQPDRRNNFIESIRVQKDCPIIHQEFIKFGTQIVNGDIRGSTLRCEMFLKATKQLLIDFVVDNSDYLPRKFIAVFDAHVSFINQCRPLAVTMLTAIKYLKSHLMRMSEPNNDKCKTLINEAIDKFLSERIDAAHETIIVSISKQIKSGDCVLVYSFSQLVFKAILFTWNQLLSAHKDKFQVYVVDSFPDKESSKMIDQLKLHNISFCKTKLSSVPKIINQIDIVLLGAHSVLSNNTVMSSCGSLSIANISKLHRKPVVILAETFKFYAENQFHDSLHENELGNADLFVEKIVKNVPAKDGDCKLVKNWRSNSVVSAVDLLYDAIPHRMITMICTELAAIIPTTASFVTNLKQPVDVC